MLGLCDSDTRVRSELIRLEHGVVGDNSREIRVIFRVGRNLRVYFLSQALRGVGTGGFPKRCSRRGRTPDGGFDAR